jgi:hypothetical protein
VRKRGPGGVLSDRLGNRVFPASWLALSLLLPESPSSDMFGREVFVLHPPLREGYLSSVVAFQTLSQPCPGESTLILALPFLLDLVFYYMLLLLLPPRRARQVVLLVLALGYSSSRHL